MLEKDVYTFLGQWMLTKLGLEWMEITHENPCIVINENGDKAEVDLCFGKRKGKQLILTDVVHVKTKDNLKGMNDKYELIGKALMSTEGVENVWICIEESTFPLLRATITDKIGVITYREKNNVAINFVAKKEPKHNEKPRFYNETQSLFIQKFGQVIETPQNVFVCSMNRDNWSICIEHNLWGVPMSSAGAESAIRSAKPGDLLLFRLVKIGFVALCVVTSEPFQDRMGGPWKKENPSEKRDFIWQVRMYPLLKFPKPVELDYPDRMNKETGIHIKLYWSGMAKITDLQYKIIWKKLIDANLNQLR